MAGKGVKIDIQRLHVSGEMHRSLGAIDHHHHPGGVSKADSLGQVRAAAGDVGHLADGQHRLRGVISALRLAISGRRSAPSGSLTTLAPVCPATISQGTRLA